MITRGDEKYYTTVNIILNLLFAAVIMIVFYLLLHWTHQLDNEACFIMAAIGTMAFIGWIMIPQVWKNPDPNEAWLVQNRFTKQKLRTNLQEQLTQDRPVRGLRIITQGVSIILFGIEKIPKNGKIDLRKKPLLDERNTMTYSTKDRVQVEIDWRASAAVIQELIGNFFGFVEEIPEFDHNLIPENVRTEFLGLVRGFFQSYIIQHGWEEAIGNREVLNTAFTEFVNTKIADFEQKFGVRLSEPSVFRIQLAKEVRSIFNTAAEGKLIDQMTQDTMAAYPGKVSYETAKRDALIVSGKIQPTMNITQETITVNGLGHASGLRDVILQRGGGGGGNQNQGQGQGKNKNKNKSGPKKSGPGKDEQESED